ncbi:MAG: isoamylase [Polyangiaceae bacterium]
MLADWERDDGAPFPLGVSFVAEEDAFNFALYSKQARAVTLLLYGASDFVNPVLECSFAVPQNRTGRVWHQRVPASRMAAACYYAYRVDSALPPGTWGDASDARKVLLDPYARGVFFPPDFERAAACVPGSNAGKAPLGLLPSRVRTVPRPHRVGPRYGHELVIYELHVRGFTHRANSGVPVDQRGTFSGVIAKIPYLKELGITAVELMPVHQFDPSEGNYWGYMTLNFFTPHHLYVQGGQPEHALAEFKTMVDALHAAGIEVILDVVYNHTTEAGRGGPTYCFRGIDNSSYYALDAAGHEQNYSGCGNDLRATHPVVRRLITDSMRYWAQETQIDGFRFDLASMLGTTGDEDDGSGPHYNYDASPLIAELALDPSFADLRLIAEPWDAGGAYLLGRAFPAKTLAQWNDRFRDEIRKFGKGDSGMVGPLAARLYGSTDLFPDDLPETYRRWQSVNFVNAHDGLNLHDLVSYDVDGQNSWDCWLGSAADTALLRRRQVKNFCALLLLSNGTPMFVAGDEFMHTQQGNRNPYDRDDETTWLDWDLATQNADIVRFFRLMIALRKSFPLLGRSYGWGTAVSFFGVTGAPDYSAASRALAFALLDPERGQALYVMINSHFEPLSFTIESPGPWRRIVDTLRPSPDDIAVLAEAPRVADPVYEVGPRSVVVLAR